MYSDRCVARIVGRGYNLIEVPKEDFCRYTLPYIVGPFNYVVFVGCALTAVGESDNTDSEKLGRRLAILLPKNKSFRETHTKRISGTMAEILYGGPYRAYYYIRNSTDKPTKGQNSIESEWKECCGGCSLYYPGISENYSKKILNGDLNWLLFNKISEKYTISEFTKGLMWLACRKGASFSTLSKLGENTTSDPKVILLEKKARAELKEIFGSCGNLF